MKIINLTFPEYMLNDFISEKCSLQKDEVKLIFDNYKFITNVKFLIKKPEMELATDNSITGKYFVNCKDIEIPKKLFFLIKN